MVLSFDVNKTNYQISLINAGAFAFHLIKYSKRCFLINAEAVQCQCQNQGRLGLVFAWYNLPSLVLLNILSKFAQYIE